MSFNPLSAAFDAQSEMLDAAADVTRKSSIAPERAVEIETIDVGQTPSTVVYEENKLELLQYESMTDEQNEVPILIVYALINKPYILDLQADRSVVRRLLEAGHDVYMIDWNEPSRLDQHLGLDDYINRYIDNCVDAVRDRSGQDSINLLGYCMGGTMSTIYAALHREKVNALGLMAAGLCFDQTGGILEEWGSEEYYDPQDVVDAYGNVPAGLLDDGFALMDPVDNYFSKYITLYENLESDGFVENFARMERWLDEGIDLAGQAYVEFLQKIYQDNELYNNELEIGGEHVDVETIDMPVLQIVGEYDHLIPAEASKPFNEVVGSDDVTTIEYPTGHIGMSVSSSTHEDVWPQVCEWYHERSEPEDAEADVESIQEQAQAEVAGDEDDADTDATASKATFEVYEDEAGQYRWRLVHRNGNIIANGGEGYASKQKAQQGLESVTANIAGARLVDETRDDGDEPAAGSSKATVELFEDADGKYRWRLVHDNGNLIADSGQGYASKQKAKQGLASVRTNAPAAPVDSVNGIGPTYAERLESAGIETTADLAEYGPAELAEIADTTESRVEDWLGQV